MLKIAVFPRGNKIKANKIKQELKVFEQVEFRDIENVSSKQVVRVIKKLRKKQEDGCKSGQPDLKSKTAT